MSSGLQDGRLDSGNRGCTITSASITGVVCCRADYQTMAFDAGNPIEVDVDGEVRLMQVQ